MPLTELYRRTPRFNDWRAVASGRHATALIQFAEAHFGTQYERHDLEVRSGGTIVARRHHHQNDWVYLAAETGGALRASRAGTANPNAR